MATLDSCSTSMRLGRQAIVIDDDHMIHLFYAKWGSTVDSVSVFTSSDYGLNWNGPELVATYQHSSTYTREHIVELSATVDDDNAIHLVYRYDGPPNYHSSYDAYPSSHISYVEKVEGVWTTLENVINDDNVQSSEGNGATVSYLNNSQLMSYNNVQHFISYDYAWWATNYHIIYSNTLSGSWSVGESLNTYSLSEYDNIMLNAPSLVVNNDSLFALWYQRHDCTIEMKKFDGTNWSTVETLFNDKYFSAPKPTSYIVRTGSVQQDGSQSVTAMLRSVPDDYNELILLNKTKGEAWLVDTIQLNEKYNSVEPTLYLDTTYLFLYSNSTYTGSIIKYTKEDGFLDPISLTLNNSTNLLLDLKSLSDASLPFAYIVRNTDNTYFLKIGKVNNLDIALDAESLSLPNNSALLQNQPNPFRSETAIKYRVPVDGQVRLLIFDYTGRIVAELVDCKQAAGDYIVHFDASKLCSGTYFCKLEAGDFGNVKKMFVIK
ncbi:MAG: T9SS type A sorting domain-containing protein [Bacteroidales bacterium]|nr:T9SS type A sorting domain-containing protein [Bacteroidales bacterium]